MKLTCALQVYLGGWLTEVDAAVAYDLGALWFWGRSAQTNVRLYLLVESNKHQPLSIMCFPYVYAYQAFALHAWQV